MTENNTPLTPEILDKCGFIIVYPGCYRDQSNEHPFVLWPNLNWPKWPGLGYKVAANTPVFDLFRIETEDTIWVEYLEQLQALYILLTGKELEYKKG